MARVNGVVATHWEELKSRVQEVDDQLSEFEVATVAALLYFQESKCDTVILECGWGGAKDATNIIDDKVLTILTHVELEHTEVLGKDIETITREKAGICREGVPLITPSQQVPEVFDTLRALKIEPILAPAQELGAHHPESVGLALRAADELGLSVTPEIYAQLEHLSLPGHFQVLKWGIHTLIIDGAHTYDSVHFVQERVQHFVRHHGLPDVFWAIHFLKDKRADLHRLFPRGRTVWVPLTDNRAGHCPEDLSAVRVPDILRELRGESEGKVLVFIGSFKLVQAVLRQLA